LFEAEGASRIPPWAHRRDSERHRGQLIDSLGTASLLGGTVGACLPGLGIVVALTTGLIALVLAGRDLDRIRQGVIDPEGQRLTEMGRNKAIVGVVLAVLFAVFCVIALVEL